MGWVSKRVLILGSTGSIGTQAIEVINANPEAFEVVGIAAGGSDPAQIIAQARHLRLDAGRVAVADSTAAAEVSRALGGVVISGPDAARDLVGVVEADTVLNALVGSMGLAATLAVLESGSVLALANKESLVAGGELVLRAAEPGQLVPVDSEHSAMAQCLMAGNSREVSRLVLTASGGPFRGWTRQQMMDVTPQQAAAHPTWSMGQMNTLNSATLVNKGLEFIEASLLFGIPGDRIDVVVHPQSIVHSMVTFVDGATIAQASPPSMKLPISLALDWPRRVPDAQPALDFSGVFSWDFGPVDHAAFPAVRLAAQAVAAGGTWPAVYNAANEEAAAAFLAGGIRFPEIVDTVAEVLDRASRFVRPAGTVDDVLDVEKHSRRLAGEILAGKR
ncbi:1-deoxy-D-xylulose-5-phosphate reductoisomerase [Corynebacterium sp. CCM 9185]|uniref:1-deoxy-D-xylulose 5-phosphate reductoisomerase n=1 Tax=Corynebacterium marambiense TaxID=2765364 RepID=A0ABS0VWR2_9CORY|nr:1-deoxy-D-xylulose-5-phosphate reductoisomerase [Corynebacterium marambiense]MBI9000739.1 1-deoxy-D-xylulose-5-phosphate reductoisomerase [Corynebacterium marambiense]MCK7662998.1 1-deoxy-D-xylulose-5-phosphate reductoisomerase [Corynebacterium marambiense]MCX7542612.1 1-deoxy-D-xylulose-5-phosphate reductoisomerase [Corynebacterium marambiense]